MLRKHLIVAAAALGSAALALAPSPGKADTATLTVTATVANSCQFTTTTDSVGFGSYTGATITRAYNAKYTCTSGDSTYKFSFRSPNSTGPGNCSMTDGASHTLSYTITDTNGSGYGCDGFTVASASGQMTGGGSNTILSYAFTFTLPANQNPSVGSYSDTNTVTITP